MEAWYVWLTRRVWISSLSSTHTNLSSTSSKLSHSCTHLMQNLVRKKHQFVQTHAALKTYGRTRKRHVHFSSRPKKTCPQIFFWLLEERQATQQRWPSHIDANQRLFDRRRLCEARALGGWVGGWVTHERSPWRMAGWLELALKGEGLRHFRTCLDEPDRALSSLEALPRRSPEFICAIMGGPCCMGVMDMRVISRCISDPVGMPRWRRVLLRLSRSREMGRGEVAVTKMEENVRLLFHRLNECCNKIKRADFNRLNDCCDQRRLSAGLTCITCWNSVRESQFLIWFAY